MHEKNDYADRDENMSKGTTEGTASTDFSTLVASKAQVMISKGQGTAFTHAARQMYSVQILDSYCNSENTAGNYFQFKNICSKTCSIAIKILDL